MQTNSITGIPYLDYDDYVTGRRALMYFHNKMVSLYAPKYNLTFDQLLDGLKSRKGQKFFMDGLGLGIIEADISEKTVQNAMEYLAVKSKGNIPSNNQAFLMSLSNQQQSEISYTDLGAFVAIQSAGDILDGLGTATTKVLNVGSAALDTTESLVSSLKWILPIIIIGGVLIYVWFMPKRG